MSEHFVNKTFTAENEKDLWQTPGAIFNALDDEFCFDIDICASDKNNLCQIYFTKERSALDREWDTYRRSTCFINPPYSQAELFMQRSAEQAKKHDLTVVALVNANTDTKWFSDAVKSANEVRLFTGRIGFVKTDGKKASGNPKGQCLIIWRGNCKSPCQITMIDRNELIKEPV
ncbi:MAG: phage N-6-adenine-methyltransferase [Nitrosomonadaceae bacterium]